MASTTSNFNLNKPAKGDLNWGSNINANWDGIDSQMFFNQSNIIISSDNLATVTTALSVTNSSNITTNLANIIINSSNIIGLDTSLSITNSSNIILTDSTLVARTIRGWVAFSGTGTIALNDSFNVAGLTDRGTGQYTVDWESGFLSSNDYAVSGISNDTTLSQTTLPMVSAGVNVTTRFAETGSTTDSSLITIMAIGRQ